MTSLCYSKSLVGSSPTENKFKASQPPAHLSLCLGLCSPPTDPGLLPGPVPHYGRLCPQGLCAFCSPHLECSSSRHLQACSCFSARHSSSGRSPSTILPRTRCVSGFLLLTSHGRQGTCPQRWPPPNSWNPKYVTA